MNKGKIIGIIICAILALAILTLLICNWTGAFALEDNQPPAINIPIGLGRSAEISAISNLGIFAGANEVQWFFHKIIVTQTYPYMKFDIYRYPYDKTPTYTFKVNNNDDLGYAGRQKIRVGGYGGGTSIGIDLDYGNIGSTNVTIDGVPKRPNEVLQIVPNFYIESTNAYVDTTTGYINIQIITKTYGWEDNGENIEGTLTMNVTLLYYTTTQTNAYLKGKQAINIFANNSRAPVNTYNNNLINYQSRNEFQQYLNAYRDGFEAGKSATYEEGYSQGYKEGYEAGGKASDAYQRGYNAGYTAGLSTTLENATPIATAKALFNSVIDIFDIKLFGFLSLGSIVGLMVIIGITTFIIHLIRS